MTIRRILLLVLLASGWACRGGEEPRQGPAAESATERQADRPRLAPGDVTVALRMRLAPGGHWTDASDVVVDAEGKLYVLDGVVPARILKFETDGRYMLRFGENEPDAAVTLANEMSLASSWNTIFLVDRSEQTVSTFLTLGMLTYSVKTGGVPIDAVGLPAFGEYYLQGWDQARSRSGVYHMRLPLDTLATTYEVAIPPNQPVRKIARDVYFRAIADGQGRLYVAFHDGYPVRVLQPDGATLRLVGIDRAPVDRNPEEVAAETADNLAKLKEQAPDVPDSLLMEAARADSVFSVVEELAVDPMGRLWVRTHRADSGGATAYDVFDSEGDYLARVDVPGDVRATAFAPDGSLVVIEGAEGLAGEVVRYEVGFVTRPE